MLFVVIYGSWNAMTVHNLPSFPIETHGSHCIDRHLGSIHFCTAVNDINSSLSQCDGEMQ